MNNWTRTAREELLRPVKRRVQLRGPSPTHATVASARGSVSPKAAAMVRRSIVPEGFSRLRTCTLTL